MAENSGSVNDPAAIAKNREQAAGDAKAAKAAKAKMEADKAAGKGVKVLSKVNMVCNDGTRLVIGKEAMLSKEEHERLSSEGRFAKKPHYQVLAK
ncbi:MAG: hypothetical protein ACXWPM_00010 [Bdellovibrionota bacterium]